MRVRSRATMLGLLMGMGALLLARSGVAEDGDARALVQRTLDALPRVPFVARITLSGDVRGDRDLLVNHKVIDGARSTYLEVVAPQHLVGMRFLFQERVGQPPVQYMRYIATSIPVLVSSSMRAERFLGSTFFLADVAEPNLDAFTYQFVGDETIDGRPCKLVESVPKDPKNEVYGKVIQAIAVKDLVVVRRRFFDQKGQASKEWTAKKLEKVSGYWTVRDQFMKDLTQNAESRIEITEITYGAEISDAVFSKEYLVR